MPQRYSVIRVSCAECVCRMGVQRTSGGTVESLDGRAAAKGSSRTEPRVLLYARGRKYFNTDACNIKGAKAVRTAIIRVLDELERARPREGFAHTRVNHPSLSLARVLSRAYVAHTRIPKIYVAYLRVYVYRYTCTRGGTFTVVREIIYSSIDFLLRRGAHLTFGFNDSFAKVRSSHFTRKHIRREIHRCTRAKLVRGCVHDENTASRTKLLEENRTALFLFFLDFVALCRLP